eukprot:3269950-Alexandrium_andersonii.AAC.1
MPRCPADSRRPGAMPGVQAEPTGSASTSTRRCAAGWWKRRICTRTRTVCFTSSRAASGGPANSRQLRGR